MRNLILTALIAVSTTVGAQEMVNKEKLKVNDTLTIEVGQTLILGEPSKGDDYAFVTEQLGFSKIVADVKADKLGGFGVKTAKESISGNEVRILKFKSKGNKKRGYVFTAIVSLANRTFSVSVPQAIENLEIFIEKEDFKTTIENKRAEQLKF